MRDPDLTISDSKRCSRYIGTTVPVPTNLQGYLHSLYLIVFKNLSNVCLSIYVLFIRLDITAKSVEWAVHKLAFCTQDVLMGEGKPQ